MAEQIKIAELQVNATQLINELKVTKAEVDKLKMAQKELTEAGKTNTSEFIKNEVALKASQNTYRAQQKTLEQVTGATRELDNEMKKEVKTLGEAAANNKALRQARENLNLTTEQGKQALEAINKKLDENTEFMRDNQDAHIQQKMNIGNYRDSILESLGVQQAYTQGTEALTFAQGIMAVAVGKSTGAMKVFRIALASTGVGLLVIALASLISYFTQTQEGIDKVQSVLEPLKSIFGATVGVLGKLGKALVDTFSNPMESIKAFGTAIETNIMNRLKAFGVIWKAFKEGDIKGMLNGLAQGATGIENLGAKVKTMGKDVSKFMGDAVKNGKEIHQLEKNLNATAGEHTKEMEKLNRVFEEQKKIGEDVNKSAAEREAAFRAAEKAQEAIRSKTVSRLEEEMRLETLKAERNGDTSRDELNAIKEKEAAIEKAYAEEAGQTTELQNSKNAIMQEAAAKAKEIRDKQLQETIASMEQELAYFDEQHRLKAKTLEDELRIMKDRAVEELEVLKTKFDNKLITEQEYLTAKLKLENDQVAKEEEIHQRDLERIKQFESEKRALEEELMIAKEEDELAKAELKAQLDFEEKARQIEAMQLHEDQKTELLRLAEENRAMILGEIQKKFQDEYLSTLSEAMKQETSIRLQNAQEAASIAGRLTQMLSGFLGDSLAAQIAGIAVDAAIQAGIVNIATNAAQAKNMASAASVGFPQNIPLMVAAGVQNAALQAQAAKSTTAILANAAMSSLGAGLSAIKQSSGGETFAAGGVLGGPSHANGGIKTPFGELEGGEAVINKRSTAMYGPLLSALNVAGGGRAFAEGGVLGSAGVNKSSLIDYDLLASKVAQANMSLPAPQVAVSEIRDTQTRVTAIEQRARF